MNESELSTWVGQITQKVTSASRYDSGEFCRIMSREHRTHQQSFTALCVAWLQHVGKDEYLTDPRNAESKRVGKEFTEAVNSGLIDPFLPMI